ncbi:hypothetical protein NUU61_009693 [Penicillium alfredii]|uniref:Uncharacterized protein n=1 Tax=Penicillium alfredii TaxID=1506179 RepID=A0A9W9EGL8_9EURO|nr:uncharacterized protein NUU61_009693 [Penicillium alfredii]KAJ5081429.1 hypothetical protein NUU61_009693 [Penicillium alfredii]
MAAVRLRKAFRYPEDSDEEHEELDEVEQERVIQRLQGQNDARNAQYSLIFTIIPLLSATIFLPSVLSAASVAERFLSLVGLASLSVTAYIMRTSPLRLDPKGKKPMSVADERLARIRAVLVPANGAVCLLLAVLYCFIGAGSSYGSRPVLYLIPGAMLVTILLAQQVMLSVDLTSLKDLQYEYKGA